MAKRRGKKQVEPLAHILPDLRRLAVAIDSVQLDPANANKHGEASIAGIAAMLREFGQRTPIVVNEATGVIAKGNGTWLAAKRLGWAKIAAVRVNDNAIKHVAYSLGDNRSAQLAEWNQLLLAEHLAIVRDQLPDLGEALLLADLTAAAPAAPGDDPAAVPVPEVYQLVIECTSEPDQKQLYERLTKEGRTCKCLTL